MKKFIFIIITVLIFSFIYAQSRYAKLDTGHTAAKIDQIIDKVDSLSTLIDPSDSTATFKKVTADTVSAAAIIVSNNVYYQAYNYAGSGVLDIMKINQDDNVEFGTSVEIGQFSVPLSSGVATFVDIDADGSSAGTEHGVKITANGADTLFTIIVEDDGAAGIQNTEFKAYWNLIVANTTPPDIILDNTTTGSDANSGHLILRGNDGLGNTELQMSCMLEVNSTADYYWAWYNDNKVVEVASIDQSGNFQCDGTATIGALATGDVTISAGVPTMNFKDTDCTDSDVNGYFIYNTTNAGSGAENVDLSFINQVAGNPFQWLKFDADDDITIKSVDDIQLTANGGKIIHNDDTHYSGGSGSSYNYKTMTEEVTITVGNGLAGVVTSGNLAPAYSLIKAIAFRVTQAPGGAATELDIGITAGDTDAYIDGASCDVLGEVGDFYTNGSVGAPIINRAAATTLTLTTNANVTVSDMKIRVVVWYEDTTAPTE